MSLLTYYDILGVPQDATLEVIKKAYRKQTRATHPDTVQDDTTQHLFVLVQNAYTVLKDESKRAAYDAELRGSSVKPENDSRGHSDPEPQEEASWGEESTWDEAPGAPEQPPAQPEPVQTPYRPPMFMIPNVRPVDMKRVKSILAPLRKRHREYFWPVPKFSFPVLETIGWVFLAVAYAAAVWGDNMSPAIPAVVHGVLYVAAIKRWVNKKKIGLFLVMSMIPVGILYLCYKSLTLPEQDVRAIPFAVYGVMSIIGAMVLRQGLSRSAKKAGEDGLMSIESLKRRTFGRANQAQYLGMPGPDIVAERQVTELLHQFETVKGIRIVHNVGNVRDGWAQHALVYGNKVALVNGVPWGEGRYMYAFNGNIIGERVMFGYEPNLQSMSRPLVDNFAPVHKDIMEVRSWDIIVGDQQAIVAYENENDLPYHLASEYQALEQIVEWFMTEEKPVVNRVVMGAIVRLMS